jgi:hypothetical protein
MDISAIIWLLVLLAIFSLVWWGVNRLAVPEPVKTIVLVIIGIIGLLYIAKLFLGGAGPLLR